MALNKFMHPRNPYKNNKPDFKKLALEHEEFRKVAKQSMDGAVTLDFKNPECLRALSRALLKSDFDLDVEIPCDRLVPAVPQRINYILWLEDILEGRLREETVGIDIGCGSSCVYPLLGHKKNNWKFIASEIDPTNLKYARENVERNKYQDVITVLEADDTMLKASVDYHIKTQQSLSQDEIIDFCMCNPPFFDTDESASRRDDRSEPKHISTASLSEKIVVGGEVEFVKRMVDESLLLKHKIRVYTSLLGKKSSVSKVKQYLREKNIPNMATTEFCQGRTMRWAIAWTFDTDITFPKSMFQQERSKGKSSLVLTVSPDITCCVYDIPALTHYFKNNLLTQLEMKSTTLHQDIGEFVCIVTATKNTWSNSRRKRRIEKQRLAAEDTLKHSGAPDDDNTSPPEKRIRLDAASSSMTSPGDKVDYGDSSSSDEKPLISFSLELKIEGVHIKLQLKLINGEQKDMLHQILQYFKNRLV